MLFNNLAQNPLNRTKARLNNESNNNLEVAVSLGNKR